MYTEDEDFDTYPAEINALLESAYADATKPSVEWKEDNGETYTVHFNRMVETSNSTDTEINVTRSVTGGRYIYA